MAYPRSPASFRAANPRGFSLTELLVVIGLLALILALLLPAIRTVQAVA
ncbi:MAG: prepilin-type N-terminal cleavage/methylation domain-containing protein, partial [Phycisphaerae bacterium]|nr:prepilin-type N-terminal cleavage/methylation domain-containing protein [Phycisphaerae bacterium]